MCSKKYYLSSICNQSIIHLSSIYHLSIIDLSIIFHKSFNQSSTYHLSIINLSYIYHLSIYHQSIIFLSLIYVLSVFHLHMIYLSSIYNDSDYHLSLIYQLSFIYHLDICLFIIILHQTDCSIGGMSSRLDIPTASVGHDTQLNCLIYCSVICDLTLSDILTNIRASVIDNCIEVFIVVSK